MVIVQLIGGLGNQMFQYAMARHLAEKNSTILKLDLFEFETYKLRRYGLHCFNIQENVATRQEIENIQGTLLQENSKCFDSGALKRTGDIYIQGYWANEKYFIDIRDVLLKEFVVKHDQNYLNKNISEQILSVNSVSLHIRRGDYVHNPVMNKIFRICGSDYYMPAIKHIAGRVKAPHFFIFSDEPDWVKRNFHITFPHTIIDCNGQDRDYEDLRLMSRCKHNIIANSSFSWWAAWLNDNSDKIVVAPKQFFKNRAMNNNEIFPKTWIRL